MTLRATGRETEAGADEDLALQRNIATDSTNLDSRTVAGCREV
jgi:hypothetical protein